MHSLDSFKRLIRADICVAIKAVASEKMNLERHHSDTHGPVNDTGGNYPIAIPVASRVHPIAVPVARHYDNQFESEHAGVHLLQPNPADMGGKLRYEDQDREPETYLKVSALGWETGLCSCCGTGCEIGRCCDTFWCPCTVYANNNERLKKRIHKSGSPASQQEEGLCRYMDCLECGWLTSCLCYAVLDMTLPVTGQLLFGSAMSLPCVIFSCLPLSCLIHNVTRRNIRKLNSIQERDGTACGNNMCVDVLATWACGCCAVYQETTELKYGRN